jgi:tetratricopeptide (TPR) repeat protein
MPRMTILILVTVLFISCNNATDSSPYKELLSQPPYSSLTDSIHQNPSDAELYYHRGVLLSKNNNIPPALADLKKAWALNKKEKYAMGISNILLENKPDAAIAFLNEALQSLPESIPIQLNLAFAYSGQQRTDEALAICNKIIQRKPSEVNALVLKSDLLEAKLDTVRSIQTLEEAYRFAPFSEDLCYNLAFKYAETKNPRVLLLCDSLQHADSLDEKGEPYYFKGLYFSNINERTKALTLFDQTIQHDYYYRNAYIEKGKILFDQKKINAAFNIFNLAAKVSPTFPDTYYWMGRCQEALGQKAEAKLNYQRAYGLDKTFTEAKEAADRLKN